MKIEINININEKVIFFIKKMFSAQNLIFYISVILFCTGALLFSTQLEDRIIFNSGDLIRSSEINQNFKNLWDKVNEHDNSIIGLKAGSGNWWNRKDNGTLYYNENNVGIGTSDPRAKLDVAGSLKALSWDSQSMGNNGYANMGGVIIQWGKSIETKIDSTTFTYFPISFPNNCFTVVITDVTNTRTASSHNNVPDVFKDKFSWYNATGDTAIRWIAIGN